MTQQIINLGSGPDTQTGDSLYTAFNKVNDNFGELYTVFQGNSITTINANVVLTNNITVSSNVRSGNLFAYGNLETIGYVIAAGVFYPNGTPIAGSGQVDSNLIPVTSNVYSIGNVTNQFTQGYFNTNITLAGANVTVRNSQLFVNGQLASGNYGNANVALYLPVYGGNISATVTTANQPYITSVGTLTGLNVVGNTSISGNLDVSGTITYLNVRDFSVQDPIITLNTGPNGAPLISNNSFDSGVRTYYYDGQNKASFFGRTSSTGYFEYYSNVISETGNIITGTYGTIKSANLILTSAANIVGNVTGNYFLGNGRFLDGIDATSIQNGNSNVKVYANGNVSVTTAGTNTWNFGTAGQLTVPGPISGLGNAKLDFTTYGANTAYLTTTNDDSTALFMGAVSADLYAHTNILIRANTGGTSQTWTFNEDGTLTLPGNLITSSNVIANYFLGNFVGNISGNISAAGTNTQVLFNDNNITNATSGLTFNKSSNLLTIGGTVSALDVNVAGFNVIDSNGNIVTSRLQNSGVTSGTYGNASSVPSITVDSKGRVTAISNVAVAGVSNVSYDTITGNLTVSTSSGTNYVVDLGVGTSDAPVFANLSISGNTIVNALTINNSATIGSTLGVTGNLISANINTSGTANVGQVVVAGYTVIDTTGNVVSSRLENTGVVAGTYGNASSVPSITVDSKGRITGVSNTAVAGVSNLTYNQNTSNLAIVTSAGTAFYVDLNVGIDDSPTFANATLNQFLTVLNTANVGQLNVNGITVVDTSSEVITSRLKNSGVTPGIYGNANAVPVFSVDEKGRVLGVSNVAIGGISNISYDTTTGNISITTSDGTSRGIDIGVGTADSPIFAGLSIYGNATANALTVNNSVTIGSTLGITGNINGNGITLTGSLVARGAGDFDGGLQSTPIGNASASTGQFTTVSATGNVTAAALTSNGSITAITSLSAAGGLQSTPIGNVTPSTAIFTGVSVSGNSTVNALTVNTSATVGTTLGVTGNINGNGITLIGSLVARGPGDFDGGLQSTPIGNASASTGQFTTVSATGNITAAALTSNGSITSGTTLSAAGGIQSTPIGNASASTGQFTTVSATGNVTAAALTANGSITAQTTLRASGGIQSTPIGNVTPSTAIFTSESVSGNSTVNALTVNNSITIGSTLGVTGAGIIYGGIQNTIIGNVTPSSATFTTVSVSGNTTTNALTVNNSTTIGSTLGVTGNIVGANIRTVNGVFATVESATVGNTGTSYTGSTYTATGSFNGPLNGTLGSAGGNSAIVSTLSGTGAAALNSLQVNNAATVGTTLTVGGLATLNSFYANTNSTVGGNLTVVGNLVVSGNVIATGSNNTYFTDSIIELHTLPNLANLTFDDGKDIGIRFHYYKTQNDNAFLGWQNSTGHLEWIGSGATEDVNANIITGSYGTFKTGEIILANATPSTGFSTGALQVNGGASFSGNLYANGVAYFGNATAITLTHPLLVATTTANTYAQIQIQNQSTGGAASSDFIATADDGTDTTKYIDMGINGSGWNQSTWTVSGPRDGYLYTSGVNLTLGTDTVGKTVKIHTGGLLTACVVATFNDVGTVSSSSTTGALVLTGGLGVSGDINGGSTLGLVGNATVSGLAVNNTVTIGSTLGVTGNINGSSLTLTGSEVATGSIRALGGLQATPIGNASASTGQFTTVSATGNITSAALTSNGSITAITTLSALGGIQNTPIGNVTPSTAIFTSESVSGNSTVSALTVNGTATIGSTLGVTGNINGSGIALTGSLVARGPGDFDGGLQSTPIGNASASTGQFTTVSATGNITGSALTSNGSITAITSLSALGGLQATPIGNASPSTALFTTVGISGNSTVNGLTVNTSATIGTNLSVTDTVTAAYFTGDGGRLTNVGNITVANTSVSNYYPVTFANVGTGPLNALNGGMRYNPSLGALAGLNTATIGSSITTSSLVAASLGVSLFNATATTINLGGAATVINVGASNVVATFGSGTGNIVAGNITAVHYGNSFGTTATYSSNTTVNALTINNSATIGTTLGVTGNATVGNILATGFYFANGTPLTTSAGGTNGQLQFNSNSAFAGATYLTYQSGNGRIIANSGITSTSNVSGAIVVSGGVGVTGNVYVSQRVGFVAANSVSVVYQIYNAATNSLDTIFG